MPVFRPVREPIKQFYRWGNFRHAEAFALFGGLDHLGLQTIKAHLVGNAMRRHNRLQRTNPHFDRLFDQKIKALLFDRGKSQDRAAFNNLVTQLPFGSHRALLFPKVIDGRQPFTIKTIKYLDWRSGLEAHHMFKVMRLFRCEFDLASWRDRIGNE